MNERKIRDSATSIGEIDAWLASEEYVADSLVRPLTKRWIREGRSFAETMTTLGKKADKNLIREKFIDAAVKSTDIEALIALRPEIHRFSNDTLVLHFCRVEYRNLLPQFHFGERKLLVLIALADASLMSFTAESCDGLRLFQQFFADNASITPEQLIAFAEDQPMAWVSIIRSLPAELFSRVVYHLDGQYPTFGRHCLKPWQRDLISLRRPI